MAQPIRPMNVNIAQGSPAERIARARAGLPGGKPAEPEVIAPGTPPTRSHDLHFHGGKTIQNLIFTNFYIGGTSSWNPDDVQSIDTALEAGMSDRNLNNVMRQYFGKQPITSTFKASHVLPGPAPSVASQGDMENLVQQLFVQRLLNNFDFASTVFNFMLPRGTVLNDDSSPTQPDAAGGLQQGGCYRPVPQEEQMNSLHGLAGYHSSVHMSTTDGPRQTIYYAVGVYSQQQADGTTNGIAVFDASWKNVAAAFYHQLNEARTDPDVEDAIGLVTTSPPRDFSAGFLAKVRSAVTSLSSGPTHSPGSSRKFP